ncbi:hypothetical protein, partial [Klebsiella quasipneumoniae]|uniref:hypothetical protein n=1 Tax=Klebsiella quasipneumoniae TaxID=1463165 RepID=UPI001C6EEB8C
PKPHSNLSQIFLTTLSPASSSQSLSLQTNPLSTPQLSHQPLPPPFPYIPESFSQYLFVIHSLPQQNINFINIFITLH